MRKITVRLKETSGDSEDRIDLDTNFGAVLDSIESLGKYAPTFDKQWSALSKLSEKLKKTGDTGDVYFNVASCNVQAGKLARILAEAESELKKLSVQIKEVKK